ncbi:MAG: glycoside hydrolase family 16 protein [Muribaculaceae bacterium]|nr:glycoside hydrolase family 16 protein [Muribaculaceae bacterium]
MKQPFTLALFATALCSVLTATEAYSQSAWNTVSEFTNFTDATNPVKSDGTNLLQGAEYSEWIADDNWVPLTGGPYSSYSGNQFTVGKIIYTAPPGRGESQWQAQLRLTTNYSIEQGKKYSVSFHVRSSAENKFTVKIEDPNSNGAKSIYDCYVTLPANQESLFVIDNYTASTTLDVASIVFDAGGAEVGSVIEIYDLNIQGEVGNPSGGPLILEEAPEGYELVWSDEFDSDSLSEKWNQMWWEAGNVNNEAQTYRPGDLDIEDTEGKIRHTAEIKDGKLVINCFKGADGKIYSARMDSHDAKGKHDGYAAWRYGYMEARLKLPKGLGTWPAFWMMPSEVNWSDEGWPRCGEIDIMEEVGADPNTCVCSLHAEGHYHANNTQVSASKHIDNMEGGWITYAMLWDNDNISMYADGKRILSYNNDHNGYVNWPYDRPYYITLNLAWGGDWGGYKGVDESVLPVEYEIDYVRVYQLPEKRATETDGSGVIFIQGPFNGVAKDGVVPSSTFDNMADNYFTIESDNKIYTHEFIIGKNLHPKRGQFKIQSEANAAASKTFTRSGRIYRASLEDNDYLQMASNGTISLKDTAPVNDGDILTLIVDLTEGATKGVIKVHPGKASSAVTTVNETATTADNIWYDLSGRRLPGKPTTPGFYINSNNKVLVK